MWQTEKKLVTGRAANRVAGRVTGRVVGLESENNAHYSLPTGSPFRLSVAKRRLCLSNLVVIEY